MFEMQRYLCDVMKNLKKNAKKNDKKKNQKKKKENIYKKGKNEEKKI